MVTGRHDRAELKARISRRLEEMLVPGAVVVWHTPDFVFEEAFGPAIGLPGPQNPPS